MMQEKGSRIFTKEQAERIFALVEELERADEAKKKGIRAKIRRLRLYWSRVAPGRDYTVANLKELFRNRTLQIVEGGSSPTHTPSVPSRHTPAKARYDRTASDEYYIINLCNEVLGEKGLQQYKFDFLRGDTGRRLPVDAYYPNRKLVVEYHEEQHTKPNPFFDRHITADGVTRAERRRVYDRRREEILPQHGIKPVIISYTDFGSSKRLRRNPAADREIVREILKRNGVIE